MARLFKTLVPAPHDRVPLTWTNSPLVILPIAPLLVLSFLARRPRTHLLRLAILPFAVWSTLIAAYAYEWTNPVYNVYNFASGLWGMFALVKAVEFACAPRGRLKVNEIAPGVLRHPVGNGIAHPIRETSSPKSSGLRPYIRDGFLDACELLSSMRGVGWDYGTGTDIYIPPEHRPLERSAFLRSTLRSTLVHFLLLDAIDTGFKLVPGVSSPSGGSIFLPNLSLVPRALMSTALHFATGVAFIAGFTMVYGILTLICVGWGQSPSAWPPVMEDPWLTTSLHDFWGRRWHQLLRQTFFIGGGYPLSFVFGRAIGIFFGKRASRTAELAGLVLGAFTASGLFHMFAMYAMGRGIEWRVVTFFSAQAVGLALERVWKATTGRRVDGWWGRIWAYAWVIIGGQWCLDAWHRRGLGGGMVIPPFLSPTRLNSIANVVKAGLEHIKVLAEGRGAEQPRLLSFFTSPDLPAYTPSMKPQAIAASLALLSAQAAAHTIFQELWVNGVSAGHLKGIRYPTYDGPITDVTSNDIICNGGPNPLVTPYDKTVIDVPAGATITHEWHHTLDSAGTSDNANPIDPGHLGPVMVYLAKIPDATQTSVTGLKWFKIAEDGLDANGVWGVTRLFNAKGKATAVIPKCIPSGNYLLRAEIIALHAAGSYPGAQFYMECAQINVTGGGSASPATVSFPGTYSGTDPGVKINIYYPPVTNYTIPGPRPFTCDGSTTPITTTSAGTTTVKPTTTSTTKVTTTTSKATTTSSSATSTSTGTVAKYGQCGGTGYTGPTTCAGSTCTKVNDYYYQCL
ncbi:hypothetical protein FRC07_003080 [Ceratobasidium sp. 392]|nr:hypothetical protein FRC07_003080 [Ceratobasidium sp. 392]